MNGKFSLWKKALSRSNKSSFGWLTKIFIPTDITSSVWEEVEEKLITADLGMETTTTIVENLKRKVPTHGITKAVAIQEILREELLTQLLTTPAKIHLSKPMVIMLVGVNGSGKTTTIAKLGYQLAEQRKKVLLIGADTFRAAAVDQLKVWAERLNLPLHSGQTGSDPGSVVFDGIQTSIARGYDYVLIDTAGRLHNRLNLMDELKKIHRVAGKALPGAPHEVWLVLDTTTGQNAIIQARAFKEAVNISGIILAKLDSSAKGGVVFALQRELGLPIIYAGVGEDTRDLVPFDPVEFVNGLLGNESSR